MAAKLTNDKAPGAHPSAAGGDAAPATAPGGLPGAPKWVRTVDAILDGAATVFQGGAMLLLVLMLAFNFANILLRNAGADSLLWVSPWTGVMMVWSVFLAFYVMYRRRLDIELMILIDRFGRRGRLFSRVLTGIAGLVVAGILLAEAPQIFARQRGNMEIVGLSRYWLSVPMLASSLMLLIHFIFDLICIPAGWSRDEPAGDEGAAAW